MQTPAVILIYVCIMLRSLLVPFTKDLLGVQPDQSRCTILRVTSHKDITTISACISKLETRSWEHVIVIRTDLHFQRQCSQCSIACIWQ